jgi:hypothetical protein
MAWSLLLPESPEKSRLLDNPTARLDDEIPAILDRVDVVTAVGAVDCALWTKKSARVKCGEAWGVKSTRKKPVAITGGS